MTLSVPVARDAAPIALDPSLVSLVQTPRSLEPAAVEKPVVVSSGSASPFSDLDRASHAAIAPLTRGLSPAAFALAFFDWSVHLAASPGKQLSLAGEIMDDASRLFETTVRFTPAFQPWSLIKPLPNDHRLSDPDWELPAFNLLAQGFLLREKWWHSATTDVSGVARSNAATADFADARYRSDGSRCCARMT
jgi:polyhydroxyalkanoate synthase subunit PhaC